MANAPTVETLRAREKHCQRRAIEEGGDWRRRFLLAREARQVVEREAAIGFFLSRTWCLTASDLLAISDHQARAAYEEDPEEIYLDAGCQFQEGGTVDWASVHGAAERAVIG